MHKARLTGDMCEARLAGAMCEASKMEDKGMTLRLRRYMLFIMDPLTIILLFENRKIKLCLSMETMPALSS